MPTAFDLSELSAADYRAGNRNFHLIGFSAFFVLGVGWLIAVSVLVARDTIAPAPTSSVVILAFIGGTVLLAGLTAMMMAPGAVKVEVGGTGVRLTYRRGRIKEFSRRDPGVKLTIWEFPPTLADGRTFPFSRIQLVTRNPQSNPLTPQAFDSILDSARSAGLMVERLESSVGKPRTVIRTRGGRAT